MLVQKRAKKLTQTYRINSKPVRFAQEVVLRIHDERRIPSAQVDMGQCPVLPDVRVVGEVHRAPLRAEEVDRLAENVVVQEARVHGEEAHEQNDVATVEESQEYFARRSESGDPVFLDHQVQGEEKHEKTVSSVTEHHCKQKWKCDDGEGNRIYFQVIGDTVSVNYGLEAGGDFARSIERRWAQ